MLIALLEVGKNLKFSVNRIEFTELCNLDNFEIYNRNNN